MFCGGIYVAFGGEGCSDAWITEFKYYLSKRLEFPLIWGLPAFPAWCYAQVTPKNVFEPEMSKTASPFYTRYPISAEAQGFLIHMRVEQGNHWLLPVNLGSRPVSSALWILPPAAVEHRRWHPPCRVGRMLETAPDGVWHQERPKWLYHFYFLSLAKAVVCAPASPGDPERESDPTYSWGCWPFQSNQFLPPLGALPYLEDVLNLPVTWSWICHLPHQLEGNKFLILIVLSALKARQRSQ